MANPRSTRHEAHPAQPPRVGDEDDLRKPGSTASEFSDFLTDSFRRSSQIVADSAGGLARAVGLGFRAYGDSLTNENLMRLSLANGFFTGTVRGFATFFDELAATARQVLENAIESPDMPAPRARSERTVVEERVIYEPIDYERLAKLVAQELKAGGS